MRTRFAEGTGDTIGGRQGCWIADERTGHLVKFVVTESVSKFTSESRPNYGYLILAWGDAPQQLTAPLSSPVLRLFSGPKVQSHN